MTSRDWELSKFLMPADINLTCYEIPVKNCARCGSHDFAQGWTGALLILRIGIGVKNVAPDPDCDVELVKLVMESQVRQVRV